MASNSASSNRASSRPQATECRLSGTRSCNACAVPSRIFRPISTLSQVNSRRVGFMEGSLPRCRNLVQQLLEYLIHFQSVDIQFGGDANPMTQHRQGAALDVVRGDELAPAQQSSGSGAAHQGDGGAWAGTDGQPRPTAGGSCQAHGVIEHLLIQRQFAGDLLQLQHVLGL